MIRKHLGYVLVAVAVFLVALAWVQSYPLGVESRTDYLYESIYPSFWIGVPLANVGLYLIASKSKSTWERLACAVGFFLFAYSIKFFFAFIEGPDSEYFRGLTENVVTYSRLSPEGIYYYQWPMLFILGAISSEVWGVRVSVACEALFFVWTIALAAGLFLYSRQTNDVRDFLSVVAYGVAAYPYLVWQFSAQAFALTLLIVCVNLMVRESSPSRIGALVVYLALVLSHAIFPVFLLFTACIMAIRVRKYVAIAASFGLLYLSNLVFSTTRLAQNLVILSLTVLHEYSFVAEATLAGPASPLDALAQNLSRAVTLSMWGLLFFLTASLLVMKKLRAVDICLGLSGVAYTVIGAVVSILGWRAVQVLIIPATRAVGSFRWRGTASNAVLIYFLIILAVFPVGQIHFFYNDTNYVAPSEQHAADTIFVPLSESGSTTDFRMMVRGRVEGYLNAKSVSDIQYVNEYSPHELLESSAWLKFVIMSPELQKDLLKTRFEKSTAALSESELAGLEESIRSFSRIYSNGHTTVLMNSDPTPL